MEPLTGRVREYVNGQFAGLTTGQRIRVFRTAVNPGRSRELSLVGCSCGPAQVGLPDLIQQRRYRYELRSSGATLATGHLTQPEPLEVGDRIEIGGSAGIVRTVEPILGEHELRLVVQLMATSDESER